MPVLFNRHGGDRDDEYQERGNSNVRPTKPASASTTAGLVAGRLVAELLPIHAPVSLARDRVCEASPVLGHHRLGLLLAKETRHNKAGHSVQLARGGRHLSRAVLYEREERPYATGDVGQGRAGGHQLTPDVATCSGRRYSASQAGRQTLVIADASMSATSVDDLMRALPERRMFPIAGADLHLWPEEV
jgi:hypothetical protein